MKVLVQTTFPRLTAHGGGTPATSVFLATSPLVDGIDGRYFEDCREATVVHQLDGLLTQGAVLSFA